MSIRGLKPLTIAQFSGKSTTTNLTDAAIGSLTSAQNCLILADQAMRRSPGYTVLPCSSLLPGAGPITSTYDFIRSVDQTQFLIVQRGTALIQCAAGGAASPAPVQVATLTSPLKCEFVATSIICYLSNGVDALRLYDNAGVLTAGQWGIAAPTATPTIAISPGTLTLTYGRRYVVCDVIKYTDSLGIQRFTISAPTPYTAHTGPIANSVVTIGGIVASGVTHHWIFATADSPVDTASSFFFEAEVAAGTTSYADGLPDSALDQTRLAPFENYPAPPSSILNQFQSRQVLIQVNQIRLSGGSDILLGIPDEAFPLDLFFNVPAGARTVTACTVLNSGSTLAVSNGDTWFDYSGYNASTFTEADRIASPGQCGPLAGAQTPFGYVFVSPSKRLWVWSGVNGDNPSELSSNVANALVGTLGMESLDTTQLANVRVHWYSYGQQHFVAVVGRSTTAGTDVGSDWMSLWGVPTQGITSISSNGIKVTNSLYPTDKFLSDYFTCTADQTVAGVPSIIGGTPYGELVKFPDSYQDAGVNFPSSFAHAWMGPIEGQTRWYWIDLMVDCSDHAAAEALGGLAKIMQISVTTLESPENSILGVQGTRLALTAVPAPRQSSVYALRASLQTPSTSVGRYIRITPVLAPQLPFPVNFDIVVQKMTVQYAPLYQGAP